MTLHDLLACVQVADFLKADTTVIAQQWAGALFSAQQPSSVATYADAGGTALASGTHRGSAASDSDTAQEQGSAAAAAGSAHSAEVARNQQEAWSALAELPEGLQAKLFRAAAVTWEPGDMLQATPSALLPAVLDACLRHSDITD